MPFRFTQSDLDLADGKKAHAIRLRERMLELYNELLSLMEAEKELRSFIKPSPIRYGLHTITPYVARYHGIQGRIRRSTWIGFADKTKYTDPRRGVQYQYGIRGDDSYWFGLWIQGDQHTRPALRDLHQILSNYSLDQIASSINSLGHSYWLNIEDNDGKLIIDNPADGVSLKQVEEFRDNLKKKRLWVSLDKVFKDHSKSDLLSIRNVPEEILKTTLELLPICNWWSGTRPRETPLDEAFSILDSGGAIDIVDEDQEPIPTDVREATVFARVGHNVVRRVVLKNYDHQCALCDIKGDDLLIASHISPWSKDRKNRGNPSNILCLCSAHDALFERGKLRINPECKVEFTDEIVSSSLNSDMLRAIIKNTNETLRPPFKSPPAPEMLKKKYNLA
ncbi:MAG: HNH endonuclease [Candidatus Aminicenantes bacterium]|nr:HNH endonuclease [Candidatus Aminicenantes bacterium]